MIRAKTNKFISTCFRVIRITWNMLLKLFWSFQSTELNEVWERYACNFGIESLLWSLLKCPSDNGAVPAD